MKSVGELLDAFEEKRKLLTPTDAAAAYFNLSKMMRNKAFKIQADPLAQDRRVAELRADVAASAGYMQSRSVSCALLGAACFATTTACC